MTFFYALFALRPQSFGGLLEGLLQRVILGIAYKHYYKINFMWFLDVKTVLGFWQNLKAMYLFYQGPFNLIYYSLSVIQCTCAMHIVIIVICSNLDILYTCLLYSFTALGHIWWPFGGPRTRYFFPGTCPFVSPVK